MTYSATTVANAVDRINRTYFLPAIQRPFVWTPEQIIALFDSLLKGYPISSFLFWDISKENRSNWQIYKFAEHFRFGEIHNEIVEPDGRDITLVLDGQQRLTSLLVGLRGSFTLKSKGKRWDNPEAWQRKRLYIDLLVDPSRISEDSVADGEGEIEGRYGLHLFDTPPASCAEQVWLKVGDILDYPGQADFDRFKDKIVDSVPNPLTRTDERTLTRNLDTLYRAIWKDEVICYFTGKDQNYDRVLGIFIRANDGGTKLSKSDLMMSVISSKWTNVSAREEIFGTVEQINEGLQRKNNVTRDFIMKSCLLLSDLDHVYKVENFNNKNLDIMSNGWRRIRKALVRTFSLVNMFGIDRENLTSLNALMPVAYWIHRTDSDLLAHDTPDNLVNRERIRRWLIGCLLNSVFSGFSDRTLAICRSTIALSLNEARDFPISHLNQSLTKHLKRPSNITGEVIDDVLQLRYGKGLTFLALSLIYDEQNWGSAQYHVDHIIPNALTARKSLQSKNIPESKIAIIVECADKIGNLQLLRSADNTSKNDSSFEVWIRSTDKDYMKRHLIPGDEDLWTPLMLPQFIKAREALLRKKFESLGADLAPASYAFVSGQKGEER